MHLPVERPDDRQFLHRPALAGAIEFKNLTFSYPRQSIAALREVSFAVGAGERVGLIGRVGSGKSTVLKLMLGLYQPSDGAVLADGTDLRQIDPVDLRHNIGAVLQEPFLFSGTVRDNITMGHPAANDERILWAARLAGVEDFVAEQPLGYDLPVGERGESISEGQRQAIALARALLLDAPLLLFDEPTSLMDNTAETQLKSALGEILPGKTLILVTHRASLLTLVDRLIVLDQGAVVADGDKDVVLNAIAEGRVPALKA